MLAHLRSKCDSIPHCFNIEYQRPMSCPTRPFDQNWCMESRYRHSSDTQSDREGDVSIPFFPRSTKTNPTFFQPLVRLFLCCTHVGVQAQLVNLHPFAPGEATHPRCPSARGPAARRGYLIQHSRSASKALAQLHPCNQQRPVGLHGPPRPRSS